MLYDGDMNGARRIGTWNTIRNSDNADWKNNLAVSQQMNINLAIFLNICTSKSVQENDEIYPIECSASIIYIKILTKWLTHKSYYYISVFWSQEWSHHCCQIFPVMLQNMVTENKWSTKNSLVRSLPSVLLTLLPAVSSETLLLVVLSFLNLFFLFTKKDEMYTIKLTILKWTT